MDLNILFFFFFFFELYFSLKNGLINVIELQAFLASSNCSMFDRIQAAALACYDFQNLFSNYQEVKKKGSKNKKEEKKGSKNKKEEKKELNDTAN